MHHPRDGGLRQAVRLPLLHESLDHALAAHFPVNDRLTVDRERRACRVPDRRVPGSLAGDTAGMSVHSPVADGELDVAIVGAGAAGTYLGYGLLQARPDWRIAIFERSDRIGGRLWSVKVDGLAKPIELGGMRYMTGHRLVDGIVTELGLETRDFDPAAEPERMFLRGVVAPSGGADPAASAGYDLPAGERGRSPDDLTEAAFLSIVPQTHELDDAGWRHLRATASFGQRPLTDWSIVSSSATTGWP